MADPKLGRPYSHPVFGKGARPASPPFLFLTKKYALAPIGTGVVTTRTRISKIKTLAVLLDVLNFIILVNQINIYNVKKQLLKTS
jgi:hypothetical protein